MSDQCCGSPHRPDAFQCHGCGNCCTDLIGGHGPVPSRFAPLPAAGMYRLPTRGGLRMFAWEADVFPAAQLEPLLVVADARRDRLVALAYELSAERCPNYDDGCTVYDDRPLVCQAFPLVVSEGADGPEVLVSGHCPARVPVVVAARVARRPEPVLAGMYPHETAAALAVPATVRYLGELVAFLSSADVVRPIRGLEEFELARWRLRGVVDLVDLVEEAGVMDRAAFRERVRSMQDRSHRRWVEGRAAP